MRSYTSHPRIAGTEQPLLEGEPSPLPFGRADFFVIALLLLFGILQFFLYEHTNDFVHEDVGYYENARSLVEHHTYGFNHTSERVQPPGLPLIIGVLCLTTGCSHAAVLRNMPVFLTLGLIVAYVLLRQERGRLVAASSCLLVASAPEIFVLVTRWIYPAFPYLLTSMLALWVTTKLEHADTRRARFWLSLLLSVLLAASVLIQSSGMALLIGLVAWMAVAFFADPGIARSRLKTFLQVLILPLIVLAFWMPRGGNSKEWPLSGYPGSYLTQLRLKSGNYPELGQASFLDIPRRVSENARSHASFLSEVLSPIWIDTSWSSLGISGVILLTFAGLCYSISQRGGRPHDWYFLAYESIYLLWPWTTEGRFFLPAFPLAAFYFFSGLPASWRLLRSCARAVSVVALPLSLLFGFYSFDRAARVPPGHGLQLKVSFCFWVLTGLGALWTIWRGSPPFWRRLSAVSWSRFQYIRLAGKSLPLPQIGGSLFLAILILLTIPHLIKFGRQNLHPNLKGNTLAADMEAASWIRSHTEASAIIMARHVPISFHYSQRRVVWFPPISNPQVLMEGIRRNGVQFVIVVNRVYSYYLPPDEECFNPVLQVYPGSLRLVAQGSRFRIYQVVPPLGGVLPSRVTLPKS